MSYSRTLALFRLLFSVIMLFTCFSAQGYDERFILKSNNDFTALNIQLEDGHKIYWHKSGDAGLPTIISLEDSINLKDYALNWPSPNIDVTGDIKNYTYSDDVTIPLKLKAYDQSKPIRLKIALSYVICGNQCVPIKQIIETTINEPKLSSSTLYATLLAAFLGGLILNFMPCVLPVLSLKLLSLTRAQSYYRRSFTTTFLGIMSSFWAISLISIFIKSTGEQFGIGMGFQQTEFIIFLCILVTIFISLTLEKSYVQLPKFLSNAFSSETSNGSLQSSGRNSFIIQDFISGVMATLLSIPCTAPFLGSAILIAIMGTPFESIFIFTSVGFGFGFPYLILISSPSLLKFLPKPGHWMEKAKQFLAMLFIASLLWLLLLVYGQLDLRPTFGLFLILILIKFVLEEPRVRAKLFIITILIIGALCLPQLAHKEDMAFENYKNEIWQEFDRLKLHKLINEGKIVVVEVTADWCLTCKYNKLLVWDRIKTLQLLSKPEIVAMRADATVYRKDIEDYLKEHGVYGIPFAVVYGINAPGGIAMPTLLAYDDIVKAIEKASTPDL